MKVPKSTKFLWDVKQGKGGMGQGSSGNFWEVMKAPKSTKFLWDIKQEESEME